MKAFVLILATGTIAVAGQGRPEQADAARYGCRMIFPEHGQRGTYVDNLWTGGVIPYQFADDVIHLNRERTRTIMDEIESWANIAFVPRQGGEPHWITVRNSAGGNSATVGRAAGGVVNINAWESQGMILHELMHTLGFLHEQQRADRDAYIELADCAYANGNYNLSPSANVAGPYDFESVSHYTRFWGCDNEEAYTVREPYRAFHESTVGTWHFNYLGPSNGDIWSMYAMYGGDPVPGPFRYIGPVDGAHFREGEVIALTWEASELADFYRIEIDRTPFFARPTLTSTSASNSYELSGLDEGTYYWRCAAVNHRGDVFPRPRPLDVRAFTIDTRCSADLAVPFGVLDLADVTAFAQAFLDGQPAADLADPVGVFDLADAVAFVEAFEAGCP